MKRKIDLRILLLILIIGWLVCNNLLYYIKYKKAERKTEVLAGIMAKKLLLTWKYAYLDGLQYKKEDLMKEAYAYKDSMVRKSLDRFSKQYLDKILKAPIKEETKDVETHEKNWN